MSYQKKLRNKEAILFVLLILVSVAVRLQFAHQTDFDSYWIHGMAESINIYGHAKWVFHPASLFGYYPLSYPSALMFFLAFVSSITGLTMNATILTTGIFFGIFSTYLVFLIGRETGGFLIGFFASLLFSLSPQILYYSSNVASGRFFLMTLYLAFLVILIKKLKLIEKKFNPSSELKNKHFVQRFFKKFLVVLTLFIVMFMTHRTAQLTLFFVASFIGAIALYILPVIIKIIRKITLVEKHFFQRYEKWNKWILIDVSIFAFVLIVLKFIDLVLRKRLWINIERRLPLIQNLLEIIFNFIVLNKVLFYSLLITIILLTIVIVIRLKITQFNIFKHYSHKYNNFYNALALDPIKYLFRFLFILAILLFVMQFFGKSLIKTNFDEYGTTEVFKYSGPIFIFLNFVINYTSSVTIFSIFFAVGMYWIFLKEEKHLITYLYIFLILAFINILSEKGYVKLFFIPMFILIAAIGLMKLSLKIHDANNFFIYYSFMFFIVLITIISSFIPQYKNIIFKESDVFPYHYEYANTGDFIKSLNCNCSTITTDELVAGVTIFASSGVPGGSHNIYYYVNKSYLKPEKVTFENVRENLKRGEKVVNLWSLPDWIFGGDYYAGRHTKLLFEKEYFSVKRILTDYREEYYIHDKGLSKQPVFYRSITPILNRIYDNPLAVVYDLKKGRVLI